MLDVQVGAGINEPGRIGFDLFGALETLIRLLQAALLGQEPVALLENPRHGLAARLVQQDMADDEVEMAVFDRLTDRAARAE